MENVAYILSYQVHVLISRLTFHIDHIKFPSFCFGSLSNGHNTIPDLKIVFEEMDCSS